MRIHILSDLHTEFAPYTPDPAADGADVVVLAGDIGLRTRGVEWARQAFRVPTFYVPGNHEYYGGHLHRTLLKMSAFNDDRFMVADCDEAIVGDVPEQGDPADPIAIRRADGSWLIDGKLSIEEFKLLFEVTKLPEESENYFQTVGGFVMSYLGRIPQSGDQFSWGGLTIEVMDMDWRRVDKVLVKQEGG